jgi:hypothetical protein
VILTSTWKKSQCFYKSSDIIIPTFLSDAVFLTSWPLSDLVFRSLQRAETAKKILRAQQGNEKKKGENQLWF